MDAYLSGMIVGRLVAAYLLVWFVSFLISRFRWRDTFRRTHGAYGLAAITLAFGTAFVASAS
jgi:hypothetical protein